MGDVYKEQIVAKKTSAREVLTRTGIIIAALAVAILVMLLAPGILPMVCVLLVILVYYLFSYLVVEFEYIFTNGDLDIDIIYSKSRRRRVFTGSAKSFEAFATLKDAAHSGQFGQTAGTKCYASSKAAENAYAFISTYKGKRLKVIFEPNETIMTAMNPFLGQNRIRTR